MRIGKCKLCEILKDPQSYFNKILYEDNNCIIGAKKGQNIICVYNKHSDNPGGKIINKITDVLLKIKKPSESIEYGDHKHFHMWIKRRRERNEIPNNLGRHIKNKCE